MSTEVALSFLQGLVEAASSAEQESLAGATAPQINQPNSVASSDETLLKALQNDSKEALSTLFLRHGRAVFNVAWRILRDEAEAADLRQDVFVYVFEKARLFDSTKGSASSWIMQIAYHRAIDRRRYLASRQHYDAPVFDEQVSNVGIRMHRIR